MGRRRAVLVLSGLVVSSSIAAEPNARDSIEGAIHASVQRGLNYLANAQSRAGHWSADGGMYPVAMTALAGLAFLLDGNTTLQGRHRRSVQSAVGFLLAQTQATGLIGDPVRDNRYMYGHGFSMLFLSEVLGEEEDAARRKHLVDALERAVEFSGRAQTRDGGWGYVSARDGQGFDEGSVTITQMQGLRAARNAGVTVPKEIIDKGIRYIERCTEKDGGVRYSLQTSGGARPPITAAAVACLFSAGEYNNPLVKKLIAYSERHLNPTIGSASYGHWHYAHYYYAQVVYRLGDDKWLPYKRQVVKMIMDQQADDGSWNQGLVGSIYTTALNLTILQLDQGMLPIYQR